MVGLLGTDDVTRHPVSLLAAIRGLVEQGITAYGYCGGYHLPPATLTGSVRGDIVHLDRIIGAGELAISDHRSSQPTVEEVLRIASDVHVAGMMTGKAGVLHLHVGDGPRGLGLVCDALERSELPPAVFYPTHVNRRRALFDEAVALAERGVPIDVTAFPVAAGEDAYAAEEALRRYWDTGLPADRITVSSDAGGCLPAFDDAGRITTFDVARPDALMRTVQALVAAGWPLERVLPPFTANVARVLLRLPRKGRLAVGCDADLVVLDEAAGVRDVMAGGVWHVQNGASVIMGSFE